MRQPETNQTAGSEPGKGSASTDSVPIVGIGASAGGLDAFTRLLRHLPADTGFAFVLVQHLDASHPSSLSTLLSRATAMPVAEASDGTPVKANRVYVIPPNAELTVRDGVLRLVPRARAVAHLPIDRFLQSLAEDRGGGALGIVLSGSGSDGSAGLSAIKEANGITFAQEPTSAEFSSMPSMAIAAGVADVVLPPEAIAKELARIAHHPHLEVSSAAAAVLPEQVTAETEHLRMIFRILFDSSGVDFSLYREATVQRRILRRLAIRNVTDLGAYAKLLVDVPEERGALYRDLLIGVTSFFRDRDSFVALQRVAFPALVHERSGNSAIRIWVPGCATGEEAYSILMALQDYQDEARTAFPVQVFASDISELSIAKARTGRYPESIAADVGPERLRQYFSKVDGSYQIHKKLREMCVFTRHNLLDDPPFARLDLISCRNVLIYIQEAQQNIIPLFHYALVDHGFLLLGRSETPHRPDLFSEVEPGQRIYSKRQVTKKPYASFARKGGAHRGATGESDRSESPPSRGTIDWSGEADRILLSQYSPPGVLIDQGLEVLEIRGRTAPFLALSPGKASLHLLKLLPDAGLFLEVEKLTQKARQTDTSQRRERVPYAAEGRSGELNVEVIPLRSKEQRSYLITFEAVASATLEPQSAPVGSVEEIASRELQIGKLTQELREAQARVVELVDAHRLSDDDSQRITEDALSANEELQSLTEELETAKEELEATNEELLTVNRELESRNAALTSARDLANATIETVRVPLVVIDGELVTRYVNAAFGKAFQISPAAATGRGFLELCGLAEAPVALRTQLGQLRAEGKPFDRLETEVDLPAIGRRVLLIGGSRLEELGLSLLTIEDVTQQREAEHALQRSEEQRRQGEKMETVGRLAGGIAHDFNNLLTVIIGDAELLRDARANDPEMTEVTQEICRTAEKAAALTEQLLTFSRRKVLQSRVFDLNPLIGDFQSMLRRLLGEQIKIVVRPAAEKCLIKADPAEIGRVVMNLCLNARDAMPAGGVLTVETDHVTLHEKSAAQEVVAPGRYVRLGIGDTGLGMDNETRQHAFEPFFTTKDASQGAGLGLATVFGIVKRSGGALACDSALGEGTRFTILLPAATELEELAPRGDGGLRQAPKGSEVVLLVEDEDAVRRVTKRILERSGYVVLVASNGREGLSAIRAHSGPIDLLVSDVLMPEMNGAVLAERAISLRPSLKVLLVSGHTEDVLVKQTVARGMPFLQKPYTPAELARKIREVLDTAQRPAAEWMSVLPAN